MYCSLYITSCNFIPIDLTSLFTFKNWIKLTTRVLVSVILIWTSEHEQNTNPIHPTQFPSLFLLHSVTYYSILFHLLKSIGIKTSIFFHMLFFPCMCLPWHGMKFQLSSASNEMFYISSPKFKVLWKFSTKAFCSV